MNANKRKIGDIATEISAYALLAGCGIPTLIASEELLNKCDEIEPEYALQLSAELYNISAVLAALSTQHERLLKGILVRLPDEIGAIVIKNPLYEDRKKASHGDSAEASFDGVGDLPF